jgi:very-short-patch-repair endonuclease
MPAAAGIHAVLRQRQLMTWIGKRNGVAHTSDARAAGFSVYEIATAVAEARLSRVRRSWLVTPDCDQRRVVAASVGGRVTCVSAAAMRGLWVPHRDQTGHSDEQTHIAVPGTSSRHDRAGLRLHWATGPAPVGKNANEDHMLNVLYHVAQCMRRPDALAVWESAIRRGLTEPSVLQGVAWRRAEAAAIAARASALSDSGLETHFANGMRAASVSVRQQVWLDGHPVDGLIGEWLVVQIDGFEHHSSAADRRRDIAADARLVTRGYVVLRFDYHQILFEWPHVLETILTAIAQGAHRRPSHQNR